VSRTAYWTVCANLTTGEINIHRNEHRLQCDRFALSGIKQKFQNFIIIPDLRVSYIRGLTARMVGNLYIPQRFHMESLERSVRFFYGKPGSDRRSG
jgi:hypothetical protein